MSLFFPRLHCLFVTLQSFVKIVVPNRAGDLDLLGIEVNIVRADDAFLLCTQITCFSSRSCAGVIKKPSAALLCSTFLTFGSLEHSVDCVDATIARHGHVELV